MNKSESKYFNTAKKMNMALICLLKKKTFEYITISDICKKAEVSRSTFYLHYDNTYDLLEETTLRLIDDFLSYFTEDTKNISVNLSNCKLEELNFICDKYLNPYLTYMKDNQEIILTAQSHIKPLGFDKVYIKMFENIFNPILDRFGYPESERNYVIMYYLNGINAVILEWLKENCQKPIGEISEIIKICVFGMKTQTLPLDK